MVNTDFCCSVIGRCAGWPVSGGRALGKGGVQWREERKPSLRESGAMHLADIGKPASEYFWSTRVMSKDGPWVWAPAAEFLRVTNDMKLA